MEVHFFLLYYFLQSFPFISSRLSSIISLTLHSFIQGIALRLEFSTKTTITECPPDAEVSIYPNTPLVTIDLVIFNVMRSVISSSEMCICNITEDLLHVRKDPFIMMF